MDLLTKRAKPSGRPTLITAVGQRTSLGLVRIKRASRDSWESRSDDVGLSVAVQKSTFKMVSSEYRACCSWRHDAPCTIRQW